MHAPLQFSFKEVVTAVADQNKPAYESMATRPFLKWVGGKRSILSELTKRLPAQYGTYREPFIGGGALYFATQPGRAYLADVNFHLICGGVNLASSENRKTPVVTGVFVNLTASK
jgi:hypothetical protein